MLHRQVSLDWCEDGNSDYTLEGAATPIVVIVPGLTGDSSSGYVRRMAAHLMKAKRRVACYNPRGQANNALPTPLVYSVLSIFYIWSYFFNFGSAFYRSVPRRIERISHPLAQVGFTEDLRRVVCKIHGLRPNFWKFCKISTKDRTQPTSNRPSQLFADSLCSNYLPRCTNICGMYFVPYTVYLKQTMKTRMTKPACGVQSVMVQSENSSLPNIHH